MSLRETSISLEDGKQILINTKEPYVIFQTAQCLTTSLLKNWNSESQATLEAACKFLFALPLNRKEYVLFYHLVFDTRQAFSLPAFAISELFKSGATIFKRGVKWDEALIFEPVTYLMQSDDDTQQALGLRIIEAVCLEMSTLWRTSSAVTFQTHHAAKSRFESSLLMRFMQLSLSSLAKLMNTNFAQTHVCFLCGLLVLIVDCRLTFVIASSKWRQSCSNGTSILR